MATDTEIDAAVLSNVTRHWAKVAMVAVKSMDQLSLPTTDESLETILRRVEALVAIGRIEAQGNLKLPRHSEVRASQG